jgi:predicted dithiol-disulfide oxidoreductase (DUF899 family)
MSFVARCSLMRRRARTGGIRDDGSHDEGTRTLAELFDGRSQLLVYHFMFGPSYVAGCPTCSSSADAVNGVLPHLHARDVTMLYVSRPPLEKLQAYKRRMGWAFPWVSSAGSDFNFDFDVSYTDEQVREHMGPMLGLLPDPRPRAEWPRRGVLLGVLDPAPRQYDEDR